MARPGLGPYRVKPDFLGSEARHQEPFPSSTSTRWLTTWSIPRSSGLSARSTLRPMRPRRSERSVSRCAGLLPLAERTCLITRSGTARSLRRSLLGRRLRLAGGGLGDNRDGLRRTAAVGPLGGLRLLLDAEHLVDAQAAQLRDLLGAAEAREPLHRRLHEVDRILRADALGEHVADSRELEHGANAAAGD